MFQAIGQKGITSTEFWAFMAGVGAITELQAPAWPIAAMFAAYALGRSVIKTWGPASTEVES